MASCVFSMPLNPLMDCVIVVAFSPGTQPLPYRVQNVYPPLFACIGWTVSTNDDGRHPVEKGRGEGPQRQPDNQHQRLICRGQRPKESLKIYLKTWIDIGEPDSIVPGIFLAYQPVPQIIAC